MGEIEQRILQESEIEQRHKYNRKIYALAGITFFGGIGLLIAGIETESSFYEVLGGGIATVDTALIAVFKRKRISRPNRSDQLQEAENIIKGKQS